MYISKVTLGVHSIFKLDNYLLLTPFYKYTQLSQQLSNLLNQVLRITKLSREYKPNTQYIILYCSVHIISISQPTISDIFPPDFRIS